MLVGNMFMIVFRCKFLGCMVVKWWVKIDVCWCKIGCWWVKVSFGVISDRSGKVSRNGCVKIYWFVGCRMYL